MSLETRRATIGELGLILEWAAVEKWNPGISDAESFYATDPTGFFVSEFKGRIVAAISAVKYGEEFGFVGLYIVHPDFRGRGFGWATWQAALEPLRERNLGLDGVLAQQNAYARSGFASAHRSVRYRVTGRGAGRSVAGGGGLPEIPREAIHAFDGRFFPAGRRAFLDTWLAQPGIETCFVERSGDLVAYGVMRPCREGWKIGPLFAVDAAAAGQVLETLVDRSAGQPVFIDVPENNFAAVGLMHRANFTPVFETARMYTRGQPKGVDWRGVFGITTLELG